MSMIRVETLSVEIAKRIREMIRKGVLKKGDRIIEKDLTQTLGISRTPLREALRILSAEGLIELIPNKGARVAQPSMRDIREMFWVMSILEGTCARVCAEKMTEDSLKRLESLHRKLKQHCQAKDHEKYMAVNHTYHSLIQELAGSKILSEVINGLRQKILLYRYRQIYEPNRLEASMREHEALQEAFRRKDSEAADQLAKKHLLNQCEVLETVYPETPDSSRSIHRQKRDQG
jgi:DNA-binding GntR family transcriptional regulator